jgi:hypothetical protein
MEAHPAAIKQVLRPFRVAFTGGRSKTFISYLADKIETTDKVGWSPGRSRGRRVGVGRVGVRRDVAASFFRLNPHGRHSAPDPTQPCSSRAEATVFTKTFQPSTPISLLCDLRDLCAMISLWRSSRAEATVFTKVFQPSTPISLLCDLRDLCAMISPLA